MQFLTEKVFKLAPPAGLFDSTVVANLCSEKSEGARRLLVKRAVESGEVIRLKPGLYCLAREFRRQEPHPFTIAGMLYPPSYVSLETALSYHGLIPEAVYQVASVSNRRTQRFQTPFGSFVYLRVPSRPLMAGVISTEVQKKTWAYIATPLRAIADLIYIRKIDWKTHRISFLVDSMRIEEDDLRKIDMSYLQEIVQSLCSHRVRNYLKHLAKELA
jgi:predicted transcriptional regulator of viral defense system